ncbi:hypothetical protein D3C71_1746470 [compost metagenome]
MKIIVMVRVVSIPMVLTTNFVLHPAGFSLYQRIIIPSWDRVNGINTPTAYSGMRLVVSPWNAATRTAEATPRKIMPFENPSRSPRTMKACGIYLSLASMNDSSGKAEYAVLAARNRITAVTA